MGIAAHAVLEAAYRGELDGPEPKNAALALWDRVVAEQVTLGSAAVTPERWRDYQLKRIGSAMRAARIADPVVGTGSSPRTSGTAVERWLSSIDGSIRGRPDRVESDGVSITVVDLKTSSIEPDEIPLAYQRQLQLYAWLWHEDTAEWPDRGEIELLDGTRLSVDVSQAVCGEVARAAIEALVRFNELVEAQADFLALATPGLDQCRFCPYRGGCYRFLETADESWGAFRSTLAGRVLRDDGDGALRRIELEVVAGTAPADVRTVSIRGTLGDRVAAGMWVVADNVRSEVALHDYWADLDSRLWSWGVDFEGVQKLYGPDA